VSQQCLAADLLPHEATLHAAIKDGRSVAESDGEMMVIDKRL